MVMKNYISKSKIYNLLHKTWKRSDASRELSKFNNDSNKSKIYLIGTPIHGNLGDQAIAYAENKFLKDNFEDYDFLEIEFNKVEYYLKSLKEIIKPDDIIMLHGGGNMGVEYLHEENLRRTVISNFKNQKIISFPQTIYFGDTELGKKELKVTEGIYNSHSNLTLVARENLSYQIMQEKFFKNNVILTPDIVLSLNEQQPLENRDNILLCFRNDIEKVLDASFKDELYNRLSNKNKIVITDTVVNYTIDKFSRAEELNEIWKSFRQSKLVITDRLHGMVFAAITGTPCIALSNYNHKVKGTYEWIRHLSYIRYVENKNDIYKHIDELLELDHIGYDNKFTHSYYNEILKIISK